MTPIVSVVMPVLNGNSEHLKLAILSILQQTMREFEFIIIDDGSNIETKRLLESYRDDDERVRIITNERNLGIAKSLNKGISVAKGEIIARHDADDIAVNTRLEQQLNMLRKNNDIVACFTAVKHIDMQGQVFSEFPVSEKSETLEAELFLNSRLCHPTMFMYKHAIDAVGGYPLTKYAQDYALYTKMIRHGFSFGGINQPLVYYRITDGGVTQSKRDVQLNIASDIAFNHVQTYLPSVNEQEFKTFWMYIATQGETELSTLCFLKNLKLMLYIHRNKELKSIWMPEFKWIVANHYEKDRGISLLARLTVLHVLNKFL